MMDEMGFHVPRDRWRKTADADPAVVTLCNTMFTHPSDENREARQKTGRETELRSIIPMRRGMGIMLRDRAHVVMGRWTLEARDAAGRPSRTP